MPHFLLRNTLISDRRLPLPGNVVVLGRSMDSDVPIPHKSVSRRHALLEHADGGYVISDLGSSQGTFVGERRIVSGERATVPVGTSFRLGKIDIVLAQDEPIEGELKLSPPPLAATAPPPVPAGPGATVAAAPRSPPPPGGKARKPARRGRSRRAAPEKKPEPPPSAPAQRRAEHLRKRRNTFRWAGIAITVVLLVLAAYFAYKIATRTP